MAKKAKKSGSKKPAAKSPSKPALAAPKKSGKKKHAKNGSKTASAFKGAAGTAFVKDVMTPVEVPPPIEPKQRPLNSGQATGTRLVRLTGESVLGFENMKLVKVPTGVAKKRVGSYLLI